ncbi:MAG TPA: hypothetical protein PK413_22375, partial [Thermoanaerobaculia bacterium]|nr:hypothetical protein [Thermoanaerobaculia bacterium]
MGSALVVEDRRQVRDGRRQISPRLLAQVLWQVVEEWKCFSQACLCLSEVIQISQDRAQVEQADSEIGLVALNGV